MNKGVYLYIRSIAALALFLGSCLAANAAAACTDPVGVTGKLIYNADYNVPQVCTGSEWVALGSLNPGAGGDGCEDPEAPEGKIIYNLDFNVPQYCDGEIWRSMIGYVGAPQEAQQNIDPSDIIADPGYYYMCARRYDATVWCSGTQTNGKIGNGTSSGNRLSPAWVHTDTGAPGWNDWTTINAGPSHACGLRENGTAWCWGMGNFGKIGDGGTTDRTRPVQVNNETGLPGWDDWQSISAGANQSCGIRNDGTAWCWGYERLGRLGNGVDASTNQPRPVQVHTDTGLPGWDDWVIVDAGGTTGINVGFNCGIRIDGTAWCWGGGPIGGETSPQTRPVQVHSDTGLPGWNDWVSISAGDRDHVCGIRSDGTAWCWGAATFGKLGDGQSTTNRDQPVQVHTDTGLPGWNDWVSISAGDLHTCGMRSNGTAWCWGETADGRVGDGQTTTDRVRPVQVHSGTGLPGWDDWVSISAGHHQTCGVRSNATLWCWGLGNNGQIGDGENSMTRTRPWPVAF